MAVIISDKCILCGACLDTCPHEALSSGDDKVEVNVDLCTECGACIDACPTNAITLPEFKEKIEDKIEVPEKKLESEKVSELKEPKVEKTEKISISDYNGVYVFIEQRQGKIASVSLELLGEGRKLADKLGVQLAGILLGYNVKGLTDTLYEHGADLIYLINDPVFEHYRSEAYQYGVVNIVEKYKPEILLFGATVIGRDLASTVATTLGTGLTADCTRLDINLESKLLEASRPAMGGNIMATILCKEKRPQMASVRARVMKAIEPIKGRKGKTIEEDINIDESKLQTRVIDVVYEVGDKINIADAQIVVAGGKGLGDEKGFQIITELAQVLGAAVGASRDAVEAGWISHNNQVGQTGTTIAPKLYFAIGISGAVQHIVGMENSEIVIAINKDPNAKIFEKCTYGIVGDAFEVVPKFIEGFKKIINESGEVKNG
ncbi:MAG: FAD-binding protein [Vulcanibacillus sp.]